MSIAPSLSAPEPPLPGSPDSGQSGSPANGWSPAGILASGWAHLLRGPKITDALPGLAQK
jgi:hypothetical protein